MSFIPKRMYVLDSLDLYKLGIVLACCWCLRSSLLLVSACLDDCSKEVVNTCKKLDHLMKHVLMIDIVLLNHLRWSILPESKRLLHTLYEHVILGQYCKFISTSFGLFVLSALLSLPSIFNAVGGVCCWFLMILSVLGKMFFYPTAFHLVKTQKAGKNNN